MELSYNPSGTLASKTDAKGQTISFGYDALDRLTSKSMPGGWTSAYGYDNATAPNYGKGQRTSMSTALNGTAKTSTSWQYDARGRTTLISQSAGTGSLSLQRTYDAADRLSTQTYNSETVTTSYDDGGRPSSLCSSIAGQACYVCGATYTADDQPDAWTDGNTVPQTGMNYTGQRLDGTGLLYYHARMYDPVLGRFVSADSVVPGSGALTVWPSDATASPLFVQGAKDKDGKPTTPQNAQELNRYSYGLNNPVKYSDPTGHCSAGISWGMVNGQCYQEAIRQYMDPNRSFTDRAIGFIYAQADIALVSIAAVAAAPLVEAAGSALLTALIRRGAETAVTEATAYDIAKAGGRNAGLIKNFATLDSGKIQKSINSLQKQALLHLNKIADPSSYASKWSEMSEQQQSGLLRYWAKEAARYAEQAEVLSGILKERKGDS